MDERVVTFEGPSHLSKSENVESINIVDDINKAIGQIVDHIHKNSGTKILNGIFYFKHDRAENLVLLFATNIKTDKNYIDN